MGCNQSYLKNLQNNSIKQSQLQNPHKKIKLQIMKSNTAQKIVQNITLTKIKPTGYQQTKLEKILSEHFFLSQMCQLQREILVENMRLATIEEGQTVFQQGWSATVFFIIRKGRVSILVNNQEKGQMGEGSCFGELSLIYSAPRAAGVAALQDCQFWCLEGNLFKNLIKQLTAQSGHVAKSLVYNLPVFNYLTKKQKDSICANMLLLQYGKGQTIFQQGDVANSFFIIASGSVCVKIQGQNEMVLSQGDSFGENAFQQGQYRMGAAICIDPVQCLSIGRDTLLNKLGSLQDIKQYNLQKWALKRNPEFCQLTRKDIQKIIQNAEIRFFQDGELVYRKGQPFKFFMISLEGEINQFQCGSLIKPVTQNLEAIDMYCREDFIKKSPGHVSLMHLSIIKKILEKQQNQNSSKSLQLKTQKGQIGYGTTRSLNRRSEFDMSELDKLIFIKKLEMGIYACLYEVETEVEQGRFEREHLKCIHIKASGTMEGHIREEKKIAEKLCHPFFLNCYKVYEDRKFICFLNEIVEGIDFFQALRDIGLCSREVGRFYGGCMLLLLQYMHSENILLRDLKPDSITIDREGYPHFHDYSISKVLKQEDQFRTHTIIGTPHYMAPEVIQGNGYSFQSDYWSFGIFVYEMVCGSVPFGDKIDDPYEIYEEITTTRLKFPVYYLDTYGVALIKKLLRKNPDHRLIDAQGTLLEHPYFQGMEWDELFDKNIKSPYEPKLENLAKSSKTLTLKSLLPTPIEKKSVREQLDADALEFKRSLRKKTKTIKKKKNPIAHYTDLIQFDQ